MLTPVQIDAVKKIATAAGDAIMEVYESDFDVYVKDDDSPLTEADLAANRLIVAGLAELTPDIPILSEESASVPYEERCGWARFWLVDPLDGTKEFLRRNGEFTVNIALVEGDTPVFGVARLPAQRRTFWGGDGIGAFVEDASNRRAIHAATPDDTVKVVVSRSHLSEADEAFIAGLAERYGTVQKVPAGSSMKLCLIAEGAAHAYPRFGPTMEWDTAAAHAILRQAGGVVEHTDGSGPLTYNKENLLNPHFIGRAAALEVPRG